VPQARANVGESLFDDHHDPLITSKVRGPVVGCFEDDVDRLPRLRIIRHAERRLERSWSRERDCARIGTRIAVLPPLHRHCVAIGIPNLSLQIDCAARASGDFQGALNPDLRRVIRVAELWSYGPFQASREIILGCGKEGGGNSLGLRGSLRSLLKYPSGDVRIVR
jgi:hypothetical protein